MPAARADAVTVAAIETNSFAFWRALCRHIPGAELQDGPEAMWFATGIPFFPFNQVLRLSAPTGRADALIDGLLDRLRARNVPFCWNVGPASQPSDLAARLQARAPERTHAMPAMARELADLPETPVPLHGFAIERVRDRAGLEGWAIAYRDAFALPQSFVDALAAAYAGTGFDESAPFRHYVGRLAGEPVACATVFVANGVAALWHIATVSRVRRHGIGAALTVAPLRDLDDECVTAALYASEMGAPVYHRLGFRELFRLQQYGWGDSL